MVSFLRPYGQSYFEKEIITETLQQMRLKRIRTRLGLMGYFIQTSVRSWRFFDLETSVANSPRPNRGLDKRAHQTSPRVRMLQHRRFMFWDFELGIKKM